MHSHWTEDDSWWLGTCCFVAFLTAIITFALTFGGFCEYRPYVAEWRKVYIPHQCSPIVVPARVVWLGMTYDCVLGNEVWYKKFKESWDEHEKAMKETKEEPAVPPEVIAPAL